MPGSQGVFGLPVLNAVKPIDIDMSMHQENRERLTKAFHSKDVPSNSIIFLKGGSESARYNTDREEFFRQESYFFWAFGANIPDVAGYIDIDTGESTLVVPYLPEVYEIWMGTRWSLQEYKMYYKVDAAIYDTQLADALIQKDPEVIYTLQGYNTDSKALLPSRERCVLPLINIGCANVSILYTWQLSFLETRPTGSTTGNCFP
eukprot:gb/GECG01001111.1/.p1 GENE.gb/GECG01001111.1/~~gb/GECG01001111.1/.p1  ORF type:complete len:204 (+),score=18.83 gb/GECG01001111.1/:1-612(+)